MKKSRIDSVLFGALLVATLGWVAVSAVATPATPARAAMSLAGSTGAPAPHV